MLPEVVVVVESMVIHSGHMLFTVEEVVKAVAVIVCEPTMHE